MQSRNRKTILIVALFAFIFVQNQTANAQEKYAPEILNEKAAAAIVPTSFYFAGQSAMTQMRNSAVARIGKDRYVVIGMVDTSGYSTEISGKYEGFLITDSPINIGGKTLTTGAYGFGFSADGKLNVFDLSSKEILSVETVSDKEIKRPRPLMMIVDKDSVRFYKGKNYAVISAN
ncbi:MAG: hypothetical protein ABI891_16030 [Acidobacteriota bacterium]